MSTYSFQPDEHAGAERWLKQFPAPTMPAGVAASVKAAVRVELARQRPSWSLRLPRWSGALAAAAMLALCAGLVMRFGGRERVRVERIVSINQFVEAFNAVPIEDAELAMLSDDIDNWQTGSTSTESSLDSLSNSIETAGTDPSASL